MLAGTRSPLVHGPQRNAQGRLVPADGYGKVKGERNKEKGQRAKAKGERRTKSCLEEEKVELLPIPNRPEAGLSVGPGILNVHHHREIGSYRFAAGSHDPYYPVVAFL